MRTYDEIADAAEALARKHAQASHPALQQATQLEEALSLSLEAGDSLAQYNYALDYAMAAYAAAYRRENVSRR